jgi:hypothetical protein
MQLKFLFLATVFSIITTLFVADVSTAQPKFLFDKIKDVRDRVENREDIRDRVENREDIRDRVENREDIRDRVDDIQDTRKERFNHFSLGNRGSSNFSTNRFPFPKKS